ncbi:hypothetical protein GPECTOR_51g728 [Gonium pectorale]|uniref:EF-hand domain-containing protein n=1 Tax=Gonium pectorale TaxID=33097 RepID=A0A150G7B9_GONPE|nr:hypothetical protein GPECTOR_51g728 [Gonium pectorale]|eukprot:KXZ45742.1 hypothetical protein GPECTOR_51g728 [Gonium pectorale]
MYPTRSAAVDLADLANVSDKWARLLKSVDSNGDGVIDIAEIVALVEEMRREQSMKRVYRFMTIGLFIVVAVLIGALSGITYGIVELTKEVKVQNTGSANYAFMETRDGKTATVGGVALDLSGLTVRSANASRRSLMAATGFDGGRRRLAEDVDTSTWGYLWTLPYETVAQGCSNLNRNVVDFAVSVPISSIIVNSTKINVVTVLEHSGCDEKNVTLASALLLADNGYTYYVHCDVGAGCDVWAAITWVYNNATAASNTINDAATSGRRRLLSAATPMDGAAGSTGGPSDAFQGPKTVRLRMLRQSGGKGGRVMPAQSINPNLPDDDESAASIASNDNCFPSSATVEVLGRGTVRMSELQYGDLVRSRDRSTSAVVHRPVFLFGHREAAGARPYVHITAAGRTLAASAGHFVPVCVARCTTWELKEGAAVMENRRAKNVRVGDVVAVMAPGSAAEPETVTDVEVLTDWGAYNPYIRGADLFVDGLLASPHSDWLLDPVAPGWMVPLLPAIYEALLAPVYGLYCAVGPATAEWLAHGLRLAELGREQHTFFFGYWVVLGSMVAPVAATAGLAYAASRRRIAAV